MKNLWPKIKIEDSSVPAKLMVEQGKHLEKITDGILTYDLHTVMDHSDDTPSKTIIRSQFYIHAPLINNYKFMLLYFQHDFLSPYPVSTFYFTEGETELHVAKDEKEFEKILGNLLGKTNTQRVISTLYTRSQPQLV